MPVTPGKCLRLRVKEPVRALLGGTAQEQLWVAMRNLKNFSAAEVAYAASTDALRIAEDVATRYLRRLRDAGYLTTTYDTVTKATNWRLVPRMNTGPKPPMLIQVSLVFDRNQREVVDGPHSEECVL